MFRADRLKTMRMRLSAAYKGVNALLMKVAELETGDAKTPSIDRDRLDGYLASHLVNPTLLRADSFDDFMADRQKQLLDLIERATGKVAYSGDQPEEGGDVEGDEDTIGADLKI
ncbi:MAG TPA: hypothetical protein DDZ51_09150 [Planctomycetaceae bacterium]|nr:hypothetical protein [Planctomycetaceae bacterium]